jgi:hypothetical protein
VEPNVVLPFLSSTLSFVFALFLLDQWLERRRPYQLIWTLGMVWYGISAGTEFWGGAFGWSEPLYRAWYLIGAFYVAAWLGLGTMYLLGKTRFGYGAAISILFAAPIMLASQARHQYTDTGVIPVAAFGIAVIGGLLIIVETYRAKGTWARVAGILIVGGSIAVAPLVAFVPLAAPGYQLDASGIPVGDLMPGAVRLLTPLFNITGAFALALGALYSTYMFMPKKRLIRYDMARSQGAGRFLLNLVIAPIAITVNLLVSIPGTALALFQGKLHSRVPATILLAIGAFIPSMTSGLSRFGITDTFFLGELLGVVFLFAGTLVSVEVFREFRVPFTHRVLYARSEAE